MNASAELLTTATLPAPVRGWRRLLVDWVYVSGATFICQAIGTVTSLLFRMVLSPAQMGVWQALKLLLANGNYANMGVSKGAARELTIAVGRGDIANAQHGLNLAFTVNTITSGLYGAGLIAAGVLLAWAQGQSITAPWSLGLIAVGVLSLLQRHVSFAVTLLRAKQDFVSTSQLSVLEGLLTLAVAVPAAWIGGLPGMYLGTLSVMLAALWFLNTHSTLHTRFAWDRREIRRLLGIGSPIMLAGLISTLFRTLDQWSIFAWLPDREHQLGCYSLALLVGAQLYGLGNMLSIVVGPRLGEHFGYMGCRRSVAELAARSSELQAAAIALPAAGAMVAAGPVLGALLPNYQSGLAPMFWLIPGTLALVLALVPGQYLVAVDRQNWALLATILVTILGAAANYATLQAGWGIVGVAVTTSLVYVVFLLLIVLPLWRDLDAGARLRCLAMHCLALGPTLLAAAILEWRFPTSDRMWHVVAMKVALVLAVWTLTLAAGWRFGDWRIALRTRSTGRA
jgi:O-antigen/teichoic acid export membrane protein